MRRFYLFVSLVIAAALACATSNDEAAAPSKDAGASPSSDAGTSDGSVDDVAIPTADSCSDDGWCITRLPDGELTLRDIWPFEDRAFAIAESPTLGVKVVEWEEISGVWTYIDDDTQNAYGSGSYAGKIWAPSPNEVYYAVASALIYRGRRQTTSSPWSWERWQLEDHSRDPNPERDHGLAHYDPKQRYTAPADYPALGVWGTSADDVYAWYANTIFHWKGAEAGAWTVEHIITDADSPTDGAFIFGAAGSGPDDVWFAAGWGRYDGGGRYVCPIILHKTADGVQRFADSVLKPSSCSEKAATMGLTYGVIYPDIPGFLDGGHYIVPWSFSGWPTNIASAGPNTAIGILGRDAVVYLRSESDGGFARVNEVHSLHVPRETIPAFLNSVWSEGSDTWISGWGLVLRLDQGPETWSTGLGITTPDKNDVDAGTFSVSTTALNGTSVDVPLYQIRGTSNTNLWAIGARYALHKTTR